MADGAWAAGAPPEPPVEIVQALSRGGEWVIVPHVLPDIDALASAESACRVLRAAGLAACVAAPDVPAIHRWALAPDCLQAGQCPGASRLAVDTARAERLQVPGPVDVVIDHHEDNTGFGAVDWVVPGPCCTWLIAGLARALGVAVDPPLATALYRGLIGDTEGFRVGLTPGAFAWAADLLGAGADAEDSAERFARRSPGFWGYLAAVEGAGVMLEGPVPCRCVPIPAELVSRFPLLPYENALLPSHIAPPPGGVLAILQEGRHNVRFRLRSRSVDVLPLAHALGGGGHPQAAGVNMQGVTLDEARRRLEVAWVAQAQVR